MDNLIPENIPLYTIDLTLLNTSNELTHKSFRQTVICMAQFLEIRQIGDVNFMGLVEQYCLDLQLPRKLQSIFASVGVLQSNLHFSGGVMLYTQRLLALSQPKMNFNLNHTFFPNYEGRAMAFVVFVLKLLFGLDGVTEYAMSGITERINRLEEHLFTFRKMMALTIYRCLF